VGLTDYILVVYTDFKYLWMQDDTGAFMTATAAVDTPLFMRAFEVNMLRD
jgi:hypothetical protein